MLLRAQSVNASHARCVAQSSLLTRILVARQDSKLGPGAAIDLSRPLSLEERQRIVTEAMGTDLEDAEDLLRRQRARLDACALTSGSATSRWSTAQSLKLRSGSGVLVSDSRDKPIHRLPFSPRMRSGVLM